jgi:uncharacterized protein YheU (UPF0270 family)
LEIPVDTLEPDTLRAVVEEFVTREGTDYGHRDHDLDGKVDAVLGQLRRRDAVLVYDPYSGSINIVPADG